MERRATEFMFDRWILRIATQEGIDLLAAYENTGVEPEGLKELAPLLQEVQTNTAALRRLKELWQAEQDGMLVTLPCVVGSHVYIEGREAVIQEFFGYRKERYLRAQFYDDMQYIDIPFDEIGKSVILAAKGEE